MIFLIENDLFNNNTTSFPIINSGKICNFKKSKMLQILFRNTEEYKEMLK